MRKAPLLSIIDDVSRQVGITKQDCIGNRNRTLEIDDDEKADPDSYQHIQEIVSNILRKQDSAGGPPPSS